MQPLPLRTILREIALCSHSAGDMGPRSGNGFLSSCHRLLSTCEACKRHPAWNEPGISPVHLGTQSPGRIISQLNEQPTFRCAPD